MKKRMKRPIALIASLVLFLCACGANGEDKAPETTYENVGPSTPASEKSELDTADVNYSSYEFTVLTAYANEKNVSIFEDEKNSAAINEKTAERNGAVEKKFNIKLKEQASSAVVRDVEDELLSGESNIDMIYAPAPDVSLLISGTKLVDLADFAAFDLTKEHYDKGAVDGLSIGDKTFALAGDFTLGTLSSASVVLCNDRLLEMIDAKKPIGKSLYETVEKGEWTFDAMYELILAADAAGADDELMPYRGFFSAADTAFSLASGLGGSIFARDRSGLPTLNVNTERFADVMEKLLGLKWYDGRLDYTTVLEDDKRGGRKENEALFTLSTLGGAKALSDAGISMSVLPMPKANTRDARYSCRVKLSECELAAIPVSTGDLSRSTAVLSELFALSGGVRDAYTDELLSGGIHDSERTVQIIADSKKYDLGDLFGWGDFEKALASLIVTDEPMEGLEEAFGARSLAAEKALDILLKRLYGENYKDNIK